MRRALLTACMLVTAGCARWAEAPPMVVGARCSAGDMTVELEQGYPFDCAATLDVLGQYRAEYEAKFGHVDLTHIPVRMHATAQALSDGAVGVAYEDAIDLGAGQVDALAHELHHEALGPSSADHHGWCVDFYPWEKEVLGLDEQKYLGCE